MLVLAVLMLAALPALALTTRVKSGTYKGKPSIQATEKFTEQATVTAIHKEKRLVTLKGEGGETETIKAGPEIKNFAQLKVGDVVKVSYTEKLTIHVEGPGTPEVTHETMSAEAKPGEKPSASVTERTTYKASITAIDKANGTATLKGYDASEFTVTPMIPANLDKVAVGDLVVFTHTMGVAASVEKVPAAK